MKPHNDVTFVVLLTCKKEGGVGHFGRSGNCGCLGIASCFNTLSEMRQDRNKECFVIVQADCFAGQSPSMHAVLKGRFFVLGLVPIA